MHSLVANSETDRLAQFADTLANATDPMVMTYFRKPLDIEAKADDSPVTQADRAIEAAMRQQITDVFSHPRHPGRGTRGRQTGRGPHLGHRPYQRHQELLVRHAQFPHADRLPG